MSRPEGSGPEAQPGLALTALALGYLALPLVLFVVGWLRLSVALPLLALMAATGWSLRDELARRVPLRKRQAIVFGIVAVLWVALSGVSGLGHRNPDWAKHDSVLKGIVEQSWPVVYDMTAPGIEGHRHGLVFYLAYYLPAGAIGKLLGWQAALMALALWTAAGIWLVLSAFSRLLGGSQFERERAGEGPVAAPGRTAALATCLFVFASGLDAAGSWIRNGHGFAITDHLEWWAGMWQYSSNTTLLFWVPHQALAGWLATALLLDGLDREGGSRAAPVVVAATLLWSPFVALGCLPMASLGVLRSRRDALRFWPNWSTVPAIGLLLVFYYSALQRERLPAALDARFIFGAGAGLFALFVVLEFGALWWLVRPERSGTASPWIWGAVGGALLVLPFFRLGYYNDFVMRTSIPALFALWVFTGRALLDRARGAFSRAALLVLLAGGAITPVTEMARALHGWRLVPPTLAATRDLPLAHANAELARQYLAPLDAFFFRYAARRSGDFPAVDRPEGTELRGATGSPERAPGPR
ncbi:MAG: hypothetical protein ABI639_02390 [Thermoanaerobaculia bacterium]